MSFKTVSLKNLTVDRNGVDEAHVVKLKESIEAGLLLNPITVNKAGRVIAGRHRYWAEHDLGHKKVDVHVVDLDERGEQLATLDENLMRKDFNALQLGELLRARKVVYEQVHADASKRGGDRSKRRSAPSAAKHFSEVSGLAERTVREHISAVERIDPKAKEVIADTEAADSIKDLTTLAKLEPADQRAVAKRVAKTGETVKQAAKSLRRAEQVEQARAYVPPTGEFEVITVDYSWKYDDELDGSDAVRGGCPYPPMSIEEICAFPIPVAKNCALFCWVTNSHLIDGSYDKVRASLEQRYDFKPKGIATWEKDRIGNGWYFRNKTEHLVLFVRGKPVFTEEKPWSHFRAPLGEHSEKPAAAYMAIEKFCASTSRLEMFARTERPGWRTTGSELTPERELEIHRAMANAPPVEGRDFVEMPGGSTLKPTPMFIDTPAGQAAVKAINAGMEKTGNKPFCGAQDGKPGPKNPSCVCAAGHEGAHSNGRRTWPQKKRKLRPAECDGGPDCKHCAGAAA